MTYSRNDFIHKIYIEDFTHYFICVYVQYPFVNVIYKYLKFITLIFFFVISLYVNLS